MLWSYSFYLDCFEYVVINSTSIFFYFVILRVLDKRIKIKTKHYALKALAARLLNLLVCFAKQVRMQSFAEAFFKVPLTVIKIGWCSCLNGHYVALEIASTKNTFVFNTASFIKKRRTDSIIFAMLKNLNLEFFIP